MSQRLFYKIDETKTSPNRAEPQGLQVSRIKSPHGNDLGRDLGR